MQLWIDDLAKNLEVSHKIPLLNPSLDAGLPGPHSLPRNGWLVVALESLPLPVAFLDGKVIIMSSAASGLGMMGGLGVESAWCIDNYVKVDATSLHVCYGYICILMWILSTVILWGLTLDASCMNKA